MKQNFLSITDFKSWQVSSLLSLAADLKQELKLFAQNAPLLAGKTLIMMFEKPSLRTHVSFEIAMNQLGGHALYLGPEHIGLGKREPVSHAACVLSGMGDAIMARVFDHQTLIELATHSAVPVINGLSNLEHPCQILADLLTIREHKGKLKGLTVAFVGDGENNVTHSLARAAGLMGFHLRVAAPKGYWMKPAFISAAIYESTSPQEAVSGADVVYTDTWISMGDEKEKATRLKAFAPYQVDASLMKLAKPDAIFMHDMPAYLGQEVTKEVFVSAQSVVFDQAENRLHAQKALLVGLLGSYIVI